MNEAENQITINYINGIMNNIMDNNYDQYPNHGKILRDYIDTNKTLKSYIFTRNALNEIDHINSTTYKTSYCEVYRIPFRSRNLGRFATAESYFDQYIEVAKRNLSKLQKIHGEVIYDNNIVPQSTFHTVMQALKNFALRQHETRLEIEEQDFAEDQIRIREAIIQENERREAQNRENIIMRPDGSLLPPGWTFSQYIPTDEEENCQICYSEFEEGDDLMIHNGMHKFHPECACRWVNVMQPGGNNRKCPTCRGFGKHIKRRTSKLKIRGLQKVRLGRRKSKIN